MDNRVRAKIRPDQRLAPPVETPAQVSLVEAEPVSAQFARIGLPSRDAPADQAPQPTAPVGLHEWRGRTRAGIDWEVHRGDAAAVLAALPAASFSCVVTSPPYYWQRDYKVAGQIGLEGTIAAYVDVLTRVMTQVRRVLTKDGLLFLNLGDTYYSAKGQPKGSDRKNSARRFGLRAVDASGLGVPRKTAIGIPWRVALAMVTDGWILRSPIVWRRNAALPEPTAHDRPWRTYELVFMFAKTPKYYFNRDALGTEEDVWTISDRPRDTGGLHSAAFPARLVERCLSIGCPPAGRVLDPFAGSGTALTTALGAGHPATGIDLNERYCSHMVRVLSGL